MKIESLQSLYLEELKDAYDFEHQLVDALPKMAESANDSQLRTGFERHLEQTRGQVERLEKVFANLGEEPKRKTCKGMKGLIKEGEEFVEATGEPAAVDAALIGAAQRVEHYEMAAYGTLRALARALGRDQDAKILDKIREQEAQTNELLTQLADSRINPRAADGNDRPSRARGEGRSRGRGDNRGRRAGSAGGDGEMTKGELYERAQELGIEGRSGMSKQELEREVQKARPAP
ncbi:MAG: DUF892 family protein [Candidatus Rokuibacteriota bacterium]